MKPTLRSRVSLNSDRMIKTIKPMVATLKPLLSTSRAEANRAYDQRRAENNEYRRWYDLKRWKDLREHILVRDLYTCQATGAMLTGKHPAADSPVVDHIKPHRGDPDLFWDPNNLRAVAKHWHDSVKQAMEKGGKARAHPDWLKPSLIPLTIVCGPPASGKTTYAKKHAGPNDLIIDLDMIAAELSWQDGHNWDREQYLGPALFRRNDLLGSLAVPGKHSAAWFTIGEPSARKRAWWENKLKPTSIIILDTPAATCIERIEADPKRPHESNKAELARWHRLYQPRPGEIRVDAGAR